MKLQHIYTNTVTSKRIKGEKKKKNHQEVNYGVEKRVCEGCRIFTLRAF